MPLRPRRARTRGLRVLIDASVVAALFASGPGIVAFFMTEPVMDAMDAIRTGSLATVWEAIKVAVWVLCLVAVMLRPAAWFPGRIYRDEETRPGQGAITSAPKAGSHGSPATC